MGERCTSGGPDLSDCMAHPRIWSSRSENLEEAALLDGPVVSATSLMLIVVVKWKSAKESDVAEVVSYSVEVWGVMRNVICKVE